MKLLVAIPCLNEAATIRSVVAGVPRRITGIDAVAVLVVDDGSTDDSARLAREAGAQVISHAANRGVGAAFQTALEHAVAESFDLMVTVDADGQFDPGDIPALVAPVLVGEADLATASRFLDPRLAPPMPWRRRWGNRIMSALISRLAGQPFRDVSCGFRAYSRGAILRLNLHGRFTYTQETFLDLTHKGLRVREVPTAVRYFVGRQSRVAGNLARYALETLLIIFRAYRDYHPLRFFWTLAALAAIPGGSLATLFLVHYLVTGHFSGQLWAGFLAGFFLVVALAFFVLGAVADMLDRQRQNQERILYLLKRSGREALPAGEPAQRPQRTDDALGPATPVGLRSSTASPSDPRAH